MPQDRIADLSEELNVQPYDDDELENPVSPEDRGDYIEGEPVPDAEASGEAPATENETPPEEGEKEEVADEPEAEEPAEDTQPKRDSRGNRIPRERFNEVNERRKAAERRAAELEARLAELEGRKVQTPETDFDFGAKERQYMELVVDGEFDKAQQVRQEIRQAELELSARIAEQQTQKAQSATEFDKTVAELNEQYPVFDPNSEDYNQDLVDEALAMHAGYTSRGYDPVVALRKATEAVARLNGLDKPTASTTEPTRPVQATKAGNAKAKLAAAKAQPPAMQAGQSGAKEQLDVAQMSEEEWDSLPDSTRARLRGDFV